MKYGAVERVMTKELWEKLESYFRGAPGDHLGAAKVLGIDYRTAKRAWQGPPWKQSHWTQTPLREKFAAEEAERRRIQAEAEAANRNHQLEELERAKKLAAEAQQVDEAITRLARNDVMGGLRALAQVREGIEILCKRIGEELARGVDAQGKPIPVDPIRALKLVAGFSHSTKQLVDAAATLANLERVKQNLPTAILGLEVTNMSLEDVEREVELAQVALGQAKQMGLVALPGGRKAG